MSQQKKGERRSQHKTIQALILWNTVQKAICRERIQKLQSVPNENTADGRVAVESIYIGRVRQE
jgi:hypothetical protein